MPEAVHDPCDKRLIFIPLDRDPPFRVESELEPSFDLKVERHGLVCVRAAFIS
jgi:hypothetical protein